jgi:glycerophosphoryl diester phosphodiesterase
LHVWVVNTPDHLDLCLELGASAVITDRPAYVRGLLDDRPEIDG